MTHQRGMERVGGAVNAGARAIPIGAPATGRRPRVAGIGLESVGVQASGRGIPVDARLRAALLSDTIQPFPTFSEIYIAALEALRGQIMTARRPARAASQG